MVLDDIDGEPIEIAVRERRTGSAWMEGPEPSRQLVIELNLAPNTDPDGDMTRYFTLDRARYLYKVLGEKINQAVNEGKADPR